MLRRTKAVPLRDTPYAMNFNFIPFPSNFNATAERTIRVGTLAPYRAQAPNISEMCVISAISIHWDFQNNTITVSNRGVLFGLCLKYI